MAERSVRFGIRGLNSCRAATWKLWTLVGRGASDVYLACREIGGSLKVSFHESGEWHIAYTPVMYKDRVEGAIPSAKDRFLEKWKRPEEIHAGTTLAYRIVTPFSAVTTPLIKEPNPGFSWIENAPDGKATEIDILFTRKPRSDDEWPGMRSMGTSLAGSLDLENGNTVWVVHWVVDLPVFNPSRSAGGNYYRGKSKDDMQSENLRGFVFGENLDGSRVVYDLPVRSAS